MKYLKVFTDFVQDMESLSYEERGRLFTAMLEYASDGSAPSLPGNERILWGSARKQIDAQRKAYVSKCESVGNAREHRNQKKNIDFNMKSREEQEQEQEQEQEHKKTINIKDGSKGAPRFLAPTLTEVQDYCVERGNDVDPERFVSYYQSNGWMVGRNKMKDWKAAVRSWERRQKQEADEVPATSNPFLQILMEEGGSLNI